MIVEEVRERVLARLESCAAEMRREFPGLRFSVSQGPVGSRTDLQGYNFHLECLFAGQEREPDDLALSVSLCHLTTTPRIMADVSWGHPSGYCEAELRDDWSSNNDWPLVTSTMMAELTSAVPRLLEAFKAAVRRGAPPEAGASQDLGT
jgi:hypothetical protein